jgi:hypothetical protein
MSQNEIIEMAEKAGFLTNPLKSYVISPYNFEDQDLYEELEAFAKLVEQRKVNQIAEACYKLPFGDTAHSFALWIKEQA